MFRSLWQHRHFVVSSIRGHLKGHFVRSRLGALNIAQTDWSCRLFKERFDPIGE